MNYHKGQKQEYKGLTKSNQSLAEQQAIEDRALFGDDAITTFVYKKTEKLSSAIHLLTNVVPKDEPLRRKLREKSLQLLSEILVLKTMPHTIGQTVSPPLTTVGELLALLMVARSSGYISGMNTDILMEEYRVLGSVLEQYTGDIVGGTATLSKRSLSVSEAHPARERRINETHTIPRNYKGQINVPQDGKTARVTSDRPVLEARTPKRQKSNRHVERREKILAFLKEHSPVSVKDISDTVSDCSEKTIQRELALLVQEGVLKKEGERRWTMYSFA